MQVNAACSARRTNVIFIRTETRSDWGINEMAGHDHTFCSIVGARPNFIKLAALSPELRKIANETIIHTGQHYDYEMSKVFFNEMHIPEPDYYCNIGSASHGEQTGKMLMSIEPILADTLPDAVIVYGDTNTTLAGALAAKKLHIPVIHIESGERSFDMTMPEEVNRVIVDHISDLLFCSTERGMCNLMNEGISRSCRRLCGDVITDILPYCKHSSSGGYYLLTIHREENANVRTVTKIFEGLGKSGKSVIFPIHPRIRNLLSEIQIPENIQIKDPVGFREMVWYERHAEKIVTDSGGVQKEAYLLNVPCVTLRENTEWVDTLLGKWNILAGTDPVRISESLVMKPDPLLHSIGIFGKKGACRRISKVIADEVRGWTYRN